MNSSSRLFSSLSSGLNSFFVSSEISLSTNVSGSFSEACCELSIGSDFSWIMSISSALSTFLSDNVSKRLNLRTLDSDTVWGLYLLIGLVAISSLVYLMYIQIKKGEIDNL